VFVVDWNFTYAALVPVKELVVVVAAAAAEAGLLVELDLRLTRPAQLTRQACSWSWIW
jgi:hypothetical protein